MYKIILGLAIVSCKSFRFSDGEVVGQEFDNKVDDKRRIFDGARRIGRADGLARVLGCTSN